MRACRTDAFASPRRGLKRRSSGRCSVCSLPSAWRDSRRWLCEHGYLMDNVQHFFGPSWPAVWTLAKIVAIVLPLVLCVAYLTLWERKVIGWMQVRRGPNRVTFFGIRLLGGWAQPIADVVKLMLKEIIVPTG